MDQLFDLASVTSEESLFTYIQRHLDEVGRLQPGGHYLPDEPSGPEDEIRWAPGALDGVLGHHGSADDETTAQEIAALLVDASQQPTAERLRALHDALAVENVLSVVDLMLDELVRLQAGVAAVRRIGLWLASTSPARGPVKIGLALLGATGLDSHVDVVRTLGAHDEFTLYAATALRNGLEDPDSELWALAASVDGWGRIQCVERLRNTDDPQIRAWLLREGYKNSVMNEYTALIAAETGGLVEALQQTPVDRALLTGAGEILSALVADYSPAADMASYPDGADAIEHYLSLMRSHAERFPDYTAVAAIRDFVGDDDRWDEGEYGWSARRCEAFHAVCREILGQPHWRDRVISALTPETADDFWVVSRVADDLGIDTFEATYARLQQNPFSGDWYRAWLRADTAKALRLVNLARTRLPLAEIASGPGEAIGLGPEFEAHNALDWTLQALKEHPGIGSDLLIVALRSPMIRNRNMALNAFQAWPARSWPSGARDLIETTAATDPDDQTRETAAQVLRGESCD